MRSLLLLLLTCSCVNAHFLLTVTATDVHPTPSFPTGETYVQCSGYAILYSNRTLELFLDPMPCLDTYRQYTLDNESERLFIVDTIHASACSATKVLELDSALFRPSVGIDGPSVEFQFVCPDNPPTAQPRDSHTALLVLFFIGCGAVSVLAIAVQIVYLRAMLSKGLKIKIHPGEKMSMAGGSKYDERQLPAQNKEPKRDKDAHPEDRGEGDLDRMGAAQKKKKREKLAEDSRQPREGDVNPSEVNQSSMNPVDLQEQPKHRQKSGKPPHAASSPVEKSSWKPGRSKKGFDSGPAKPSHKPPRASIPPARVSHKRTKHELDSGIAKPSAKSPRGFPFQAQPSRKTPKENDFENLMQAKASRKSPFQFPERGGPSRKPKALSSSSRRKHEHEASPPSPAKTSHKPEKKTKHKKKRDDSEQALTPQSMAILQ